MDYDNTYIEFMADFSWIILLGLSNGVRKTARRVDITKENVSERVASFLARKTGPDNSLDVGMINPGHQHGTNSVNNDNSVFVNISNSFDLYRCVY